MKQSRLLISSDEFGALCHFNSSSSFDYNLICMLLTYYSEFDYLRLFDCFLLEIIRISSIIYREISCLCAFVLVIICFRLYLFDLQEIFLCAWRLLTYLIKLVINGFFKMILLLMSALSDTIKPKWVLKQHL